MDLNDFIKFLSKSVRIFGFFGKILDFSSNLRSSPWNIGNCLASGLSDAMDFVPAIFPISSFLIRYLSF